MKRLLEVTQKAKADTARLMTSQLRQHAHESGWDGDVIDSLQVVHEDGKFRTQIHPDYAARAFTHEYGSETVKPTGTIRKYMNDPIHTGDAFMAALEHHWKKAK